jgi:hypothetical protein
MLEMCFRHFPPASGFDGDPTEIFSHPYDASSSSKHDLAVSPSRWSEKAIHQCRCATCGKLPTPNLHSGTSTSVPVIQAGVDEHPLPEL